MSSSETVVYVGQKPFKSHLSYMLESKQKNLNKKSVPNIQECFSISDKNFGPKICGIHNDIQKLFL